MGYKTRTDSQPSANRSFADKRTCDCKGFSAKEPPFGRLSNAEKTRKLQATQRTTKP